MATFCLLPQYVDKFKKGLVNREIDPFKLADMTSDQRRDFLASYVGKDNAQQVNALFESKLLLKNKITGYKTWVNHVSGITPRVRRDLLSRIEKMDRVLSPAEEEQFLSDLAATKLGFNVTQEEAETIFKLSKRLKEAKIKMKDDFTWETKADGNNYGAIRVTLENYISSLKEQARGSGFVRPTSIGNISQDVRASIKFTAQNTRAFAASFDNSLWGNQGVRTAVDPIFTFIWAKDFAKSFKDIAIVLAKGKKAGDEILNATKAEIYSRKNSLNGRYEMSTPETSKLDLGGIEEEFPTSLPSRIPVLGRFFKAAEVAYEAGAMRLRADIADKVYSMAEKQGINMNDKFEVGSRNVAVNSITGRARIKVPNLINDAVFSVKFTKSQVDFLTVNAFDKLSPSARMLVGGNIFRVIATTAVILGLFKAFDPESTDFDPRSSKFGKVEKDGITIFNLTPGYGGMITLISRLITNTTKNREGVIRNLGEGYGVPDGMDVIWQFTENKASPIAAIVRDLIRRETFEGNKPFSKEDYYGLNYITSISLDSSAEILADKSGNSLLKALAISLGILGTGAGSNYYPDNWNRRITKYGNKTLAQFKNAVGDEEFKRANDKFNEEYEDYLKEIVKSKAYQELTSEERKTLLSEAEGEIQNKIFKSYNFKYKREKKSSEEKRKIKKLLP